MHTRPGAYVIWTAAFLSLFWLSSLFFFFSVLSVGRSSTAFPRFNCFSRWSPTRCTYTSAWGSDSAISSSVDASANIFSPRISVYCFSLILCSFTSVFCGVYTPHTGRKYLAFFLANDCRNRENILLCLLFQGVEAFACLLKSKSISWGFCCSRREALLKGLGFRV